MHNVARERKTGLSNASYVTTLIGIDINFNYAGKLIEDRQDKTPFRDEDFCRGLSNKHVVFTTSSGVSDSYFYCST